MSVEERFWAKVDKSGGPDACWPWMAAKNSGGYGTVWVGGKSVKAHRFAYELGNGPIPYGLCACHMCDNPGCVNPAHLFIGTASDNMMDKETKGRGNHPTGNRNGRRTRPEAFVANRPRGETHSNAKLSASQVLEIRALYAAGGVTQRALARRFGVVFQHIHDIVRGKRWATQNV